jgi:hypothetical protein
MIRGERLDCVEEMLLAELAALRSGLHGRKIPQWVDAVAQLLAALPPNRSGLWILCIQGCMSRRTPVMDWSGNYLLAWRVAYWRNK